MRAVSSGRIRFGLAWSVIGRWVAVAVQIVVDVFGTAIHLMIVLAIWVVVLVVVWVEWLSLVIRVHVGNCRLLRVTFGRLTIVSPFGEGWVDLIVVSIYKHFLVFLSASWLVPAPLMTV